VSHPPGELLPLTRDVARAAAQAVLELPGADGAEVVVAGSTSGLTRYALSEIIQNTVRSELRAHIRVVAGDRLASATTNQLDPERMLSAAQRALEAAQASPPDAEFPGLPDPNRVGGSEPCWRWDDATAATSPDQRAAAVRRILSVTGGNNTAGIYETGAHCYGVFNSNGVDCFDAYTRCASTCLVDNGDSTGWGDASSHDSSQVDVEAMARRATAKADRGRGARDAEPGTYEVVLEAAAVATLIEYLSYSGFGAKQVIEGESFLATKAGTKVAADGLTVADDVYHPRSVGPAFDFEGIPKRRVAVIDSGTAVGPVSDLRTASKLGVDVTGHSSGSTEFGPYAAHVVVEGGSENLAALIGGVERGLLVTRFHYVNILDRPGTLLTGMTRDGLFSIRDGEIAEPLRNLRFTQSVLDALASVTGIGSELESFAPEFGSYGSTVAPALRAGEFRFTSGTTH
jgi:PmbA protein